ncbi:MAG: hypothetical protein BWX88_03423 [Planctomycetes bacterium ADurb.Bin126]|nr:MAG: hypothetical protein BWX88_03423 [Planctomycetes bacterium ADurb.Bin126]HOD81748.1 hypothetical protein [Phycisphaerae bacterium]HQL74710.1 hypothetical protein [Phycisphaerae bacterium]
MGYDPTVGVWLQRDPLPGETNGYPDGQNLYEYVSSKPTIRADPYGLAGTPVSQPKQPTTQPASFAVKTLGSQKYFVLPDDYDLIILVTSRMIDPYLKNNLKTYAETHPKTELAKKQPASVKDLADIIVTRSKQLATKQDTKVAIKVLIIGHGSPQAGPHMDDPNDPLRVLQIFPFPETPGSSYIKDFQKDYNTADIRIIRGYTRNITFTNCAVRDTFSDPLWEIIAADLGTTITAGSRGIRTLVGSDGILIRPHLLEGDTKDYGNYIYTTNGGAQKQATP